MNISINNIEDKIRLFCDAFGDSEKTAREFFSCKDIITVIEYVGDRLAAMASLIPIHAENGVCCQLEQMASIRRNNCGYYIYGVCVDKKFRGMGLFRSVMEKAEDKALANDADFVCLIPADESLAATYYKWGYDIEILNVDESPYVDKRIFIDSVDFRNFAIPAIDVGECRRMYGLMKVLNKKIFSPDNRNFAFGDHMGDI